MRMLPEDASSGSAAQHQPDIEVTWEDQQSINAFSRLNSAYSDIEEDLRIQQELQESLSDLSTELELVLDEDEPILYKVADTFIKMPLEKAQQRLQNDQKTTEQHINQLQSQLTDHQNQMNQLKVKLYAKFGDNINLERE